MAKAATTKEALKKEDLSFKEKIKKLREQHKIKKQQIKHSGQVGYSSGSYDYPKLPKVKGATSAAKKNYGKALKDGQKLEKQSARFYGGRIDAKKGKK